MCVWKILISLGFEGTIYIEVWLHHNKQFHYKNIIETLKNILSIFFSRNKVFFKYIQNTVLNTFKENYLKSILNTI